MTTQNTHSGNSRWARNQENWVPVPILPLSNQIAVGRPLHFPGSEVQVLKSGITHSVPLTLNISDSTDVRTDEC